jgi:bacterioferritin
MKGNDEVLRLLNELLTNELTAINQYFIHSKMCANWGYDRLAAKMRAESIDEMRHNKLRVGETVKEQFESDLQLEYAAIKFLNESIEAARKSGDNGTEDLMRRILVGEEEHTDWVEAQLELIKQIGEQNYLTQQIRV